jgi:hypothetical protein
VGEEQFPVDGEVKPEHVAVDCDFNVVFKLRRDCEKSCIRDGNECAE